MGFVINNNLAANNSYRNLNNTQNDLSKSLEKLSTGLRINRAGDDAAGLSISEGLKSQVTGSAQAARNAQDGISVIQTAEGALTEVHSILQRMRDLAVQGANDTNNADARGAIKDGSRRPRQGTGPYRESTNFNGIDSARGPASLNIQVGTGGTANDTDRGHPRRTLDHCSRPSLARATGATGFLVTDATTRAATITAHRLRHRGCFDGSVQTWVHPRTAWSTPIKTLNVAGENLQAAQSRIADVDMAQEMVKFTKANILSQAGTAMLAQANQSSQGVLSLLR